MWMEKILLGFSQGPGHGISGHPSGQSTMYYFPGSLGKQFLHAALLNTKTPHRARNRVVWTFLTGTMALTETRKPTPMRRTIAEAEDPGWSRAEVWGERNCVGNNQWGACHQRAVFPLRSSMFLISQLFWPPWEPPQATPQTYLLLCMLFVTILLPEVLWETENFIIQKP